MKQELLKLIEAFEEAVYQHNTTKKHPLDDTVELTFENFIKWLRWEI